MLAITNGNATELRKFVSQSLLMEGKKEFVVRPVRPPSRRLRVRELHTLQ